MASRSSSAPALRYLAGIGAAFAGTVGLTAWWMRPPQEDLIQLAGIYGLTALASVAVGFGAQRSGLWRRLGSLAGSLTLGYILAAGLTLINVWVTARLMFISQHDLALAGVLLLFASGISVSFGYLLSRSLAGSLRTMIDAAENLSQGDFSARVPVEGTDEVALLGRAFNRMASRLELADAEAQRLEDARRDFVAWVSHDLRTPLAALRAMIDAMAEGVVTEPDNVARYLKQSQSEIDRLNGLIDDLFELSRLDTGHLQLGYELCSLSDLVSDTVGSLAPRAAAKGVAVTAEIDAMVDPVRIAPRHIGRALHNLLDNALRHTPAGGSIELRVYRREQGVEVAVHDTGEGVNPAELDLIFERFYRAEASRSRSGADSAGAGLGLAIARGMIEAHGGRIWAESNGQGATFRFTLPNSHLAAQSASAP
jgi:signal transduction histidine kinase